MPNWFKKLYQSQHLPGWLQVIIAIIALVITIPSLVLTLQQLQQPPSPTPEQTIQMVITEQTHSSGRSCSTTVLSRNPGINTIGELYNGPSSSANRLTKLLNVGQEVVVTQRYPEEVSSEKTWYQIETVEGDSLGWIHEDFLAPLSQDCSI